MIRADREVTDFQEIINIVSKCDVCRLGINGTDGLPYILPLNFGYSIDGQKLTLYFHSALNGLKHELMKRDPRVVFEMDCRHELASRPERGYCTMNYCSVMGRGVISYVTDSTEKLKVLTLLTDRYHPEFAPDHFPFNPAALHRTAVYKLTVETMTGKRK